MRSNYAQGSYSEQYDDNCICGFLHLVVMLASKLLLFLPHRLFVRPSPRSLSLSSFSVSFPVFLQSTVWSELSHLSTLVCDLMNISKWP